MRYILIIVFSFIILEGNCVIGQGHKSDSKLLERALDYFASGKYHEALLLFKKIDEKYNLNPRFKAYIGVCYYHEYDYENACLYLGETIDQLNIYSPNERSVYYNVIAESYFMLNDYTKAIPFYEKKLLVCQKEERGDIYYRLGFCYMFNNKWECANEYFKSSLTYYYIYNANLKGDRIAQLKRMIKRRKKKTDKHQQ